MENRCKVSVIVPVYNVESYLGKCLDSLVNQTLQEIEIIVVNDGSLDNSQSIINDFQKRFSNKIVAFQKENGGLSDARNFGLDRAKGEFVGFVDSDDYVSELMFEEMYFLAKKHNAEMTICNLQKVDEKGFVTQNLAQLIGFPERIILQDNLSVFSDVSYFACNKLFRSDLFNQKRFKKGIHFEDIELIPKILLDCNAIAFTPEYHYNYLERKDSITKSHTLKGLDILSAVDSVTKYYYESKYANNKLVIKDFQILEAIYSFLAYLAFVKNDKDYYEMSSLLSVFVMNKGIKMKEILQYKRFGKNYLLSLPIRKKIYYLLYLMGFKRIIRIVMK